MKVDELLGQFSFNSSLQMTSYIQKRSIEFSVEGDDDHCTRDKESTGFEYCFTSRLFLLAAAVFIDSGLIPPGLAASKTAVDATSVDIPIKG